MKRIGWKHTVIAGGFLFGGLGAALVSLGGATDAENNGRIATQARNIFNSNLITGMSWTDETPIVRLNQQWIDQMTTGSVKTARTDAVAQPGSKSGSIQKSSGLFGSTAIPFSNISTADKWRRAHNAADFELSWGCELSTECIQRKAAITNLVEQGTTLSFFNKLSLVNSRLNELITYQADLKTYKSNDYWATPSESLAKGLGDCEDYVLAKMAVLRRLNVPAEAMSLVVLKDTSRNLYHAVLAVSTNKGTFILDNVRKWAVMDSQLPHYLPLYSFSEKRSWIHGWKRSQKRQLALAGKLDLSSILPGESFAASPVLVDGIDKEDLDELRPALPHSGEFSWTTSKSDHTSNSPWSIAEGIPG